MVSVIRFSSEITCAVHLSTMSCDTSVHLTFLSMIGSARSQKGTLAVNPGKIRFDFSLVLLDMITNFSRGEGLILLGGMNVRMRLCLFQCDVCLSILLAHSELKILWPSLSPINILYKPALPVLNGTCHSIKPHKQKINFHLYCEWCA